MTSSTTLREGAGGQFRDQVARRLAGELTEDEFRPLRLHERAVPAASRLHAARRRFPTARCRAQMRMLGAVARRYDRATAHFTTRQNIQYNWPKLEDIPDILANWPRSRCTRSRPAATASAMSPPTIMPAPRADESRSTRALCRDHPAVVDAASGILVPAAQVQDRRDRRRTDRAAIRCTISACMRKQATGELGFAVMVGGGQGRTPMIGQDDPRLPAEDICCPISRRSAGLQPARPPRQQVQGADQDPGA